MNGTQEAHMRKNPTGIWMLAVLLVCLAPAVGGADGLIIVSNPPESPPGHFGFAPLQVLYHHVNVTVKGLVAVTEVDQEFFNSSRQRLEGTYVFPVPAGRTSTGSPWRSGGK